MDNAAILVPTYSKNEHYIGDVVDNYSRMWPGHPPLTILTDGKIDYPNVIRLPGRSFVDLIAEGTELLVARTPSLDFIFLILEDLCPLWPVDLERMYQACSNFVTSGHGAATFPFYDWVSEVGSFRQSSLASLREDPSKSFFQIPTEYKWKNSLAPGLWRVEYLRTVCDAVRGAGISDPWHFEEVDSVPGWDHVVANFRWPTVRHGFLVRGEVNPLVAIDPNVRRTGLYRSIMRHRYGASSYPSALAWHYLVKLRRRALRVLPR